MHHYFTFNDLALFAYNESDCLQDANCRKKISESILLSKSFKRILELKKYLSETNIGPSESTIKNILSYSRALSVSSTKNAGRFGLVLN